MSCFNVLPVKEEFTQFAIILAFGLCFYFLDEIKNWIESVLSSARITISDTVETIVYIPMRDHVHVIMTVYTWFEVTANKIAQFLGTSLEPCAKGMGNGKVKKTCPFVTTMKKFHRPKPRHWLTTSSGVTSTRRISETCTASLKVNSSLKLYNSPLFRNNWSVCCYHQQCNVTIDRRYWAY